MSLYKFIHMPLLKNDALLKQNKNKNKKSGKQFFFFLKRQSPKFKKKKKKNQMPQKKKNHALNANSSFAFSFKSFTRILSPVCKYSIVMCKLC